MKRNNQANNLIKWSYYDDLDEPQRVGSMDDFITGFPFGNFRMTIKTFFIHDKNAY